MRGNLPRAMSENDFFAPSGMDANNCRVVLVTFDIFAVFIHRPDMKYAVVRRIFRRSQNTRIAPAHNLGEGN